MTKVDDLRNRINTGEWFRPKALAEELGCTEGNVYLLIKRMRDKEGRVFEKRGTLGNSEQRLLPEGTPATKALVPTKSKAARKQATHATEAPALGTLLGVNLLAMDDDGEVTIGLRNGKRTYLVKLVGVR